jgi:hypothetical protein
LGKTLSSPGFKNEKFAEIFLAKKKKEKALPSLFYNKITSLKYKEIQFERLPEYFDEEEEDPKIFTNAYQIHISSQEIKAIKAYVENLIKHKEDSSEFGTGTRFDYQKKADKYFQGFLGEYAFVKLGILKFNLPLGWDDQLREHNEGDNGDVVINNTVIDIKSKNYKACLKGGLHYDIVESKIKKCHYFIFTFVELLEDGSGLVEILGYEPSEKVNLIKTKKHRAGKFSYLAKRVSYNRILPIDDFFKLSF